jgi:hypothetical protein
VYVSMFCVTLGDLLSGYIGIKKKKKSLTIENSSLSNWASCLKAVSDHVKR